MCEISFPWGTAAGAAINTRSLPANQPRKEATGSRARGMSIALHALDQGSDGHDVCKGKRSVLGTK